MRRVLLVSTLLLLSTAGAYAVIHNPFEREHGYYVPDPCLWPALALQPTPTMPATSGDDYTHYMLPAERPASVPEPARSTHPDTAPTESPAPTPTPAPRGYLPGDTNCDGIVSAADIDVLICRLSRPTSTPPADNAYGWHCWKQSDLNHDGAITFVDLEQLAGCLNAEPPQP